MSLVRFNIFMCSLQAYFYGPYAAKMQAPQERRQGYRIFSAMFLPKMTFGLCVCIEFLQP